MPRLRYPLFVAIREREGILEPFPRPLAGLPNPKREKIPNASVKGRATGGPKADFKSAATLVLERSLGRPIQEADFANPQFRSAYRAARASKDGRQKSKPVGADMRQFGFNQHKLAFTTSGNVARLTAAAGGFAQKFKNPTGVLPCIERASRRAVMFALGKAGKGYRVKHRRNQNSGIPC